MTFNGFTLDLGDLAQVLLAAAALVAAVKGKQKLKEKHDAANAEQKDE